MDSHIDELVKRTQINDQKWIQFQMMETEFLSRTSLSELINYCLDDSASSFELDAVSLVLVNSNGELKDFLEEGGFVINQQRDLIFVEDDTALQSFFGKTRQIYAGAYQQDLHSWLYPNSELEPGSLAILPLYRRGAVYRHASIG